MPDPSPITRAIRDAIEVEFARSPAPPTIDDIAAAVLRALADHQIPAWDGGPLCHWLPDYRTRQELRNIAAELDPRPTTP